jgi:alkaline phosphatase
MKRLSLFVSGILLFCSASAYHTTKPGKPKNIILMIGDGTGLVHLYAAYTAKGGQLNIFDYAKAVGISITASLSDYITDSAAGATALSTGQKTKNGMIGMGPDSTALKTIAESAYEKGMSTGAVVTCELPHATPASFFAHQASRKKYKAIVADMTQNSAATILIGSGLPYFDTAALKQAGYTVSVGIPAMHANKGARQICFTDTLKEPHPATVRGATLTAGSAHAIKHLSKNKKGFFLMIEGSQIDWGAHNKDSAHTLSEAIDFDNAAGAVLEWAKQDKNTLVIITADHECGGLTLHGYNAKDKTPVMHFSSGHHTAEPVPVFAFGPGAQAFSGVYQNTDIYNKMMRLLGL